MYSIYLIWWRFEDNVNKNLIFISKKYVKLNSWLFHLLDVFKITKHSLRRLLLIKENFDYILLKKHLNIFKQLLSLLHFKSIKVSKLNKQKIEYKTFSPSILRLLFIKLKKNLQYLTIYLFGLGFHLHDSTFYFSFLA